MQGITNENKVKMYASMVRIRLVEEKLMELFADGKIPGFIHVSIGQEAAPVGVAWHMKGVDKLSTTHRGHGHAIARGISLKRFMAEIFGKKEGFCLGRSGSMHIADKDIGLLGANGIVGAGIPIAAGAAFASKYKSDGGVAVCFFGDGATSEGVFHETMNMAALLKLPLIFVCENNQWAQFTPQKRQMALTEIGSRAAAYGIPGNTVENKLADIYDAAGQAFERARAGEGPSLLEIKSLRWHGHYVGDQQKYRPPDNIEEAKAGDCIEHFLKLLLEDKTLSLSDVGYISDEINNEIKDAVSYAERCAPPGQEDLLTSVYAK